MTQEHQQTQVEEALSFKDFLQNVPPGRERSVKGLFRSVVVQLTEVGGFRGEGTDFKLNLPLLELHCDTPFCDGIRYFDPIKEEPVIPGERSEHFVTFRCRNCRQAQKTYALWAFPEKIGIGKVFKYGEFPFFGPPTPARVISLIGPDKEYFLKGRRAENQGLGIGAFAYYRRVVENQKNRIFDQVMRVSKKIGASKEILEDLQAAKEETQFSKAVEAVKHGIPQTLLLNGQNPLTLLHSALSGGLHDKTDEQCLELAKSIRVVLTELVERMANALKDEAELNAAVSRLRKTNTLPARNSEVSHADGLE